MLGMAPEYKRWRYFGSRLWKDGAMASHPTGSWSIEPTSLVTLTTEKIGPTSLEVRAPVTGGHLEVTAKKALLRLELSLAKLKASNFLMQGAARALIKRYDGDALIFDASGAITAVPWQVSGQARAGSVDIPMTVEATPNPVSTPRQLTLGGTVTMEDIEIPIPGLSGISSVTFSLAGLVGLSPA
jgi:hypothetical protein